MVVAAVKPKPKPISPSGKPKPKQSRRRAKIQSRDKTLLVHHFMRAHLRKFACAGRSTPAEYKKLLSDTTAVVWTTLLLLT